MEDFEKTPGKIKKVFSKIKEFFTKPTVFTENVGNNDNNTAFFVEKGSYPLRDILIKADQVINEKYLDFPEGSEIATNDLSKFGKGLNLVIDFINKNYPLPKNKLELTVDSHNINLSDNLFYNLDINFNGNELSVSTEEPLDFKSGLYDEKNPLSYYKKTPIDFKKDKRAFGVFEKETQQFHLKVLDRENEELPNFSGYKAMTYDYVWGSDGVGLKAQFSCNETIYDENLKDVASYEPLKGDPTTTNSVSLFVMDKDSEEVITNSFYKKSNELIKKINENTVEKATAVLGINETETCVQ